MNKSFYDFYFTVIKNRDDKEILNNKYEDNENDCINSDVFITPNLFIGRKNDDGILR